MSYQQESSQQAFRWHYSEFDDNNFQIRGRTLFFIIVLFSVILLVGLLFLYARWVCRFGPPPSRVQHAPPPPRGLDASKINDLPIVLYKSGNNDLNLNEVLECCICLGIFGNKERVKIMPDCQHCFHSECVDKWLTVHSTCPLCRASIRVDSPV